MTSEPQPLHLALEVDGEGAHPSAWRASGRPPSDVLGPRALRDTVLRAEAGGFTLVTYDDSPLPPGAGDGAAGRLEAVGRAAHSSPSTDRIGLAPTAHTTTTEPFHLAAQLASLDHVSNGRAGWVVGATDDTAARRTVGAAAPVVPDGLRQEVVDVVEVVRALWDSWEDDAVIKDVPTGRYLDPDRVHHVDFEGSSFSVKGPLITPRPPQGQVVVLAADSLGIARHVDVVLAEGSGIEALRERAERAREAGAPLVFAEVEVLLDARQSAVERLSTLDRATPWAPSGRFRHVGSPEDLVRSLLRLATVVDGVRLHPAVLTADLPVLVDRVLPALASAGVHRPPRPGGTLRSSLGLPRPANRFATTS
ncbi:LLM class flavin-dependent oxidoreductase [Umezawaea sp. Da 62-37]|uniref:LLM class flavin-dependent oxidoreductase n=1 Tax=Umezawaea sp. Da 62-37 TaxID=3075927 RepID=UPI0028F72A64|nr:LLM class flavin-dependent oxidoreductase [Umezawaea sp. Da 62-37]WNV86367.1 LLM class flavin-dependent oxidoreductase [Umezawaea sp. Da 62-37]